MNFKAEITARSRKGIIRELRAIADALESEPDAKTIGGSYFKGDSNKWSFEKVK